MPLFFNMERDGLLLPEYDYLNDSSLYKFEDPEAKKLFDFVFNKMFPRVRNFDFEFDWLFSFYMECKKKLILLQLNLKLNLTNYINSKLKKIKDFFYIVFVENDLEKAEVEVEEFLSFFEKLQDRFFEIHRELLDLYLI